MGDDGAAEGGATAAAANDAAAAASIGADAGIGGGVNAPAEPSTIAGYGGLGQVSVNPSPVADEASNLSMSDLQSLQAAGLGSLEGINPNNPTQSVDEAIAAQNVGAVLAYTPQVIGLVVPGFSTMMTLGQTLGGLASGQVTPGQALTGMAMSAVAQSLGIPMGTLSAMVNGNMGQAAANTALGMVSQSISQATGVMPGAVGLGMSAMGIPQAVSAATAQPGATNLGQVAQSIDSALSGMGLSLGSAPAQGTGAIGMADATSSAPDYLTAILGIGANLITTEGQAGATQSAAERGANAATAAAATQAAAAEQVRQLQQQLRAPYTQLGQTAATQYAQGIAPGGQFTRPFSMQDAQNTAAMQEAQRAAAEATQQSAASRGGLLSANTQEALQRRAADIGAQYQNQAFNQYLAQQQLMMRPLEQAMTLGAGQTGAQAGAESEALMTAGTGAANALLASAGLQSAADIQQANLRSGQVTDALNLLYKTGVLKGVLNPGGGGTGAGANVAPVEDRSLYSGGSTETGQMFYVPYTMDTGQTGTLPMFNLPANTVYPGEMGFGG